MKQTILFLYLCFLCLLFSYPAVAELSDQEIKEFVEQLATPFPEKKIFYRWQSEEFRKKLIETGEWTPELYEHYMRMSRNHFAGSGLYVSEYIDPEFIPPSQDAGETLIQVEVGPDYKYLDLSKRKVQKKLKKKNIDIYRLKELDLQIAIKYSAAGYDKWVLKGYKGMRFQPFSSRELNLEVLENYYDDLYGEREDFFKAAVKSDILNRIKSGISIFGSPFMEILAEAEGKASVKHSLNAFSSSVTFKTIEEVTRWLRNGNEYLSDHNKKMVAKQALNLPIENVDEATDFLRFAKPHLSDPDIDGIIKRTPIGLQSQGEYLLTQTNLHSSYSYVHPYFLKKENPTSPCKEEF